MRRSILKLAVAVGLPGLALHGAAVAQADWPERAVRIICPFPAGASTDVLARAVAQRLQERTGKPVTVENITGGALVPAALVTTKAAPDGHVLLLSSNATFAINPHVQPRLPYAPERDLAPITLVGTTPNWLVVRSDRPERTLADLVRTMRERPGSVTISVNAVGGTTHLALEGWKQANGLDFTVVPYRGSPPAFADMMGGSLVAMSDVVGSTLPHVQAGRAKALAVLQPKRSPFAPDVPSTSEVGVAGLEAVTYLAFATTGGTPPAVVERIWRELKAISAEPEFAERLKSIAYENQFLPPAATADLLRADRDRVGEIVKAVGFKLN